MKFTNKHGLPQIIVDFLTQDNYDYKAAENTLSVTTLLKPTQETILIKKYKDQISTDVIDLTWRLFGSAVHSVLEKIEGPDIKKIKRLYSEMNGLKISGKFDLIKANDIYDFKVTSVWTIIYKSGEESWKKQLSIYRWLNWKTDNEILNKIGYIIVILRDWSMRNIIKLNYPKLPIMQIPFNLMDFDEVETFLDKKTKEYLENKDKPDNELLDCTDEERWYNKKQDKYIKCEKYCSARAFCQQYKGGKNNEKTL